MASTPSSPARAATTETIGAVLSETPPAGSDTRATAQKNSGGLLRYTSPRTWGRIQREWSTTSRASMA